MIMNIIQVVYIPSVTPSKGTPTYRNHYEIREEPRNSFDIL